MRPLYVLSLLCLTIFTNAGVCTWVLDPLFNGTQFNTSYYCAGDVVTYGVSNYSLANFVTLHNAAQNLYMQVANRWYMTNVAGYNGPGNDCLGIARAVICAFTFSSCFDPIGDVNAVCKFYCDLWTVRCPTEIDLYNMMCFNTRDGPYCSNAERLEIPLILFLVFSLQFFVFF